MLRSFWSTRVFRATVVYPSWRALLKTDKQIGRKRWIVENDNKSLAYTSTYKKLHILNDIKASKCKCGEVMTGYFFVHFTY